MQDDIRPPQIPKPSDSPPPKPRGHDLRAAFVQASETLESTPSNPDTHEPHAPKTLPLHRGRIKSWWLKLKAWWYRQNRNERFGIIAVGLLFFMAVCLGIFYFTKPQSNPSIQISKKPKPVPVKPTTVASPLSGVQVSPEQAARPVTGIMVENSPDARPQSGIDQAGVIYEAIAEGGITRFLTLYEENQPQYVGPVRSLRPYYLDWLVPFDASIAHVGGSPDALAQVRGGMKDLDQFFNAGSYWRVSSRAAPHNVYTSFEKMNALNNAKGYTSSKVQSFPRKADSKVAAVTVGKIDIAISSTYFNVHYDYDAATNSYLRSEGGQPHKATSSEADKTGQQLHPKVVIVPIIPYSIVDATGHSGYNSTGTGQVYIFQDGIVTAGTWTKTDRANQFAFADEGGKPIKLNAGQTWITVVGASSMLRYAL